MLYLKKTARRVVSSMSSNQQHQEMLAKYAEVIVKIGLNLRAGQPLSIRTVTHTSPLVREITRVAYEQGASYVDVIWSDEGVARARAEFAPRDSFEEYPEWQIEGVVKIIERGGALLSIAALDPDLLNGLDSEFVGKLQQVQLKNFAPVSSFVMRNAVNWCVVAAAGPAWARKIFPDLDSDKAQEKLWQAIFEATRVTLPDPIAAWDTHNTNLRKRGTYLTTKKYTALHYKAPGTDFTMGLPPGHKWVGGNGLAENGIVFTANMPTEEIFTLPDRRRAEGIVAATFPLSYAGTLIEDFGLEFKNGRIVKVHARKNEAILQKLVDTDEGSTRLGEAALVPASSPIGKRGHLFYNTLFDENASCHIAIGRAYRFTLIGGEELNDEEFMAAGGNMSLNHVDFMIGSDKMDIDGITADGAREPIMRQGEWAFDA
jgi:aminopeptidase